LDPMMRSVIRFIEAEFVIFIQSRGSDKVYVSTQSVIL
jgi:hypothetical protein